MARFFSIVSLCLSITSLILMLKTYDIQLPSPVEVVKNMSGTTTHTYHVERTDQGYTFTVEPRWHFGFGDNE